MTDLVLHILFRYLHIISVILFLGGVVYARQVLSPVLNVLPEDLRMQAAAGAQLRYRATLYTLLVVIVVSGLYNFLRLRTETRTDLSDLVWHQDAVRGAYTRLRDSLGDLALWRRDGRRQKQKTAGRHRHFGIDRSADLGVSSFLNAAWVISGS